MVIITVTKRELPKAISCKLMGIPRVRITDEAARLVEQLRAKHGELMFHQSGGCCDGSSPMCYPKGEFLVGSSDVWLGEIAGCNFYMAKDQFEFWQHTELT